MVKSRAATCNAPKLAQEILDSADCGNLVLWYDGFSDNQRYDGRIIVAAGQTDLVLFEADVAHNPQVRGNTIDGAMETAIQAAIDAHTP